MHPLFPRLGRQLYGPIDAHRATVDESADVVVKAGRLRRGSTGQGWQNGDVDGFEGYLHDDAGAPDTDLGQALR